jgi:hypothetical protein
VGRQVILLEGENAEEVQTALLRLLSAMRRVLNIADEPMVNILCSYTGATWRLIVFPRRKHRPDVYFNKGEDRILISPASIDIGGLIVTPIEKDFKTVDAVIIQRIFDEICLEGEVLDKVLEAMR